MSDSEDSLIERKTSTSEFSDPESLSKYYQTKFSKKKLKWEDKIAKNESPNNQYDWIRYICRKIPVILSIMIITFIVSSYILFCLDPFSVNTESRSLLWMISEAVTAGFLFTMFSISYGLTMFTDPGDVHDYDDQCIAYLSENGEVKSGDELNEEIKSLCFRFCKWCSKTKPYRAHHCHKCKKCVLRMDHHCPWINNCIGWKNHKYFILAVLYGTLCCNFIGIAIFRAILKSKIITEEISVEAGVMLTSGIFVSVVGVALICFLFFHIWMILEGRTTIEFYEKKKDQNLWSKGSVQNFLDALGPSPILWFIPIDNRTGNGYYFLPQLMVNIWK